MNFVKTLNCVKKQKISVLQRLKGCCGHLTDVYSDGICLREVWVCCIISTQNYGYIEGGFLTWQEF
jgi:hypothetical protein